MSRIKLASINCNLHSGCHWEKGRKIPMHQHTYHCTQHDSGTNASIKNQGVQTPEGLHVMRHGMFILKSTKMCISRWPTTRAKRLSPSQRPWQPYLMLTPPLWCLREKVTLPFIMAEFIITHYVGVTPFQSLMAFPHYEKKITFSILWGPTSSGQWRCHGSLCTD